MSELINRYDNRATIRWKLLTGASALALTAYVSSAGLARAEDAGQPQIWITLGGNIDQPSSSSQTFAPPFFSQVPNSLPSPSAAENRLGLGHDWDAELSFQPKNSDWNVSLSMRYGRASKKTNRYDKTNVLPTQTVITFTPSSAYVYPLAFPNRYERIKSHNAESHAIVDFAAGKDVGLGTFGSGLVSGGMRYAEFTTRSNFAIGLDPDSTDTPPTPRYHYHKFNGTFSASRSFKGIGPSISLKASVPIAGDSRDSEITLDWGANGAVLFGRQKARGRHSTKGAYYCENNSYGGPTGCPAPTADAAHRYYGERNTQISQYQRSHSFNRKGTVVVPNLGAFAGISYRLPGAKVSIGYRADFFFNAIDGGIDARKSENRAFYGPYASISIGLGD